MHMTKQRYLLQECAVGGGRGVVHVAFGDGGCASLASASDARCVCAMCVHVYI